MSAQTAADLRAAAKLLVEKGWTQGYYAHDAAGNDTEANTKDAVCFCALGALARVRGVSFPSDVDPMALALCRVIGTRDVDSWNDAPGRTAEEVIAALLAAADAEERAS